MTTLTRTAIVTDRPSGLIGSFEGVRARFAKWRIYRRTLGELQTLSGRELTDLGLSRSSIRRVALEAAYGDRA